MSQPHCKLQQLGPLFRQKEGSFQLHSDSQFIPFIPVTPTVRVGTTSNPNWRYQTRNNPTLGSPISYDNGTFLDTYCLEICLRHHYIPSPLDALHVCNCSDLSTRCKPESCKDLL